MQCYCFVIYTVNDLLAGLFRQDINKVFTSGVSQLYFDLDNFIMLGLYCVH